MDWLIVGLGNPGMEYVHSRHNVGFRVVDDFHHAIGATRWKQFSNFRFASGMIRGQRVGLAKPMTFMNLSGVAVRDCIEKYSVNLSRLVVVHDDLDLTPGRIKVKFSGGSGGHKGIDSIIRRLGETGFTRVRIGIGRPFSKDQTTEFVLSEPEDETEREQLRRGERAAVEVLKTIVTLGYTKAMNMYNRKPKENRHPSENGPREGRDI